MKSLKRLFVVLALGSMATTSFATADVDEAISKVQSLYIYNFAKYIQWENVGSTFNIGIYASEEKFAELESILKVRKISGKTIKMARLTNAAQANAQHIVFVSSDASGLVSKIKNSAVKNTLVVSENDLVGKGAAISFVIADSKMKFKLDEKACAAQGLKVSNSLIALAL